MKNILRRNFIRMIGNRERTGKAGKEFQNQETGQSLAVFASMEEAEVYEALDTYPEGLSREQISGLREKYGENRISKGEKHSFGQKIGRASCRERV